jgi:hypothetical protein
MTYCQISNCPLVLSPNCDGRRRTFSHIYRAPATIRRETIPLVRCDRRGQELSIDWPVRMPNCEWSTFRRMVNLMRIDFTSVGKRARPQLHVPRVTIAGARAAYRVSGIHNCWRDSASFRRLTIEFLSNGMDVGEEAAHCKNGACVSDKTGGRR